MYGAKLIFFFIVMCQRQRQTAEKMLSQESSTRGVVYYGKKIKLISFQSSTPLL